MGQSPLKIEGYYLNRFSLGVKKEFEAGMPEGVAEDVVPKVSVEVETGHAEHDVDLWRVAIDIQGGKEQEFPYLFDISYVGFFRVLEGYPEEKKESLVSINAPSILFAAAREFLALAAGRSPYPAIMLPSISFVPEPEKKPDIRRNKKVKRPTNKPKRG